MRATHLVPILGLSLIGVAGALVVIVATPWGIGLSPDSAAYIGGARSLIGGNGYSAPTDSGGFAPIVHFPPLYSFVLAVLAGLGADPLPGARWLAAALFACNVVLAGALGFATSHSTRLSLMIGLFSVTALPMIQVHTVAWSEPLFILLQLSGVLLLLSYLRSRKQRDLIPAAVIFGCGALVRYAGLAMVFAGIVGVLLLGGGGRRARLIAAIAFAAIAFLPVVAWVVRNLWVAESLVNRSFSFHPITGKQIAAPFYIVYRWLSFYWLTAFDPTSISLIVLTLIGTAWVSLEAWRMKFSQLPTGICDFLAVRFLGIVVLSYLLTLFGSISFLDAWVPIDSRLLSPDYIPLLVIGVSVGAALWRSSWLSGISRTVIVFCLMLTLAAQAAASINWLEFSYHNGVGYADREWRNSETLAKLGSLPTTNEIYSNGPDVLYTLRGIAAAMIPRKVDPLTSRPNQQFASEMIQLKQRLNEGRAVLVYFSRVNWRWYLPSAEEVEAATGMRPRVRARDGVIF